MSSAQNVQSKTRWIRFLVAYAGLGVAVWLAYSVAQAHAISHASGHDIQTRIAYNLTRIGFVTLITFSLLLLVIPPLQRCIRGAKDWTLAWAPLAIAGNVIVEKVGKTFFKLPRPYSLEKNGFPSGHAMFAFLLAWLVTEKYPKLAPLWYGAAVAIGWGRVEAGAHYPYQVLGGALFGMLMGWAISTFVRPSVEADATHDVGLREPISHV